MTKLSICNNKRSFNKKHQKDILHTLVVSISTMTIHCVSTLSSFCLWSLITSTTIAKGSAKLPEIVAAALQYYVFSMIDQLIWTITACLLAQSEESSLMLSLIRLSDSNFLKFFKKIKTCSSETNLPFAHCFLTK